MIDVFLSCPTWLAPEFHLGLERFLAFLTSQDLRRRTLGSTDYPAQCPLDEVIRLMELCKGAIILGYPQVNIERGVIKDEPVENKSLSTEWNHIEAGLAYATGLPLLVIHHPGISRGIFDRGALNVYHHSCDLTAADWPLTPEISGALAQWKAFVQETPSRPRPYRRRAGSSSTNRRYATPDDLTTAVELLEDEYRVPREEDLSGEWLGHLDSASGFPIVAKGHFTGRAADEWAAILMGVREVKYKIVVLTENASGEPQFLTLESGDGSPKGRYVSTLAKGSHPVSRSVWKHGGPRTLHLTHDAVIVGAFEGASCAYYWDDAAREFQAQWMSD
jgi:hypothetical protein